MGGRPAQGASVHASGQSQCAPKSTLMRSVGCSSEGTIRLFKCAGTAGAGTAGAGPDAATGPCELACASRTAWLPERERLDADAARRLAASQITGIQFCNSTSCASAIMKAATSLCCWRNAAIVHPQPSRVSQLAAVAAVHKPLYRSACYSAPTLSSKSVAQ